MLQINCNKTNNTSFLHNKSNTSSVYNKDCLFKSRFNSNSKALELSSNYAKTNVNFCGSTKFKISEDTQFGTINHQTAFFREFNTDEFIQNYIRENFSSNPRIRIVSGACSNGDEAKSYSMMLDDMKDKIDISGFDIDRDIIDEANNLKAAQIIKYSDDIITSLSAEDIFFEDDSFLIPYQRECKKKFNKYYSMNEGIRTYVYPEAKKQLQELENNLLDEDKIK